MEEEQKWKQSEPGVKIPVSSLFWIKIEFY